jgi:4-hydroxy-2-oxoheptanedioate aldolase
MRENSLRRKLAAGQKAVGLWAGLGSEATLEMAAPLGFDWVLIDCEHGVAHYEQLPGLLRALGGSDITSVIRVPTKDDPSIFKRVLDIGVEGVMVPQVYNAEDVKAVVSACRYPPDGERGIAAGRGAGYGLDFMGVLREANKEVMVIVQIETKEALDSIDEILSVPGLDAILIGPADMSAALGHTLDFQHADVVAAFNKIQKAAAAAGKPAGFYCNSPKEAQMRFDQGFSFANICNDAGLLLGAYTKTLRDMKDIAGA